jgi:hypothetical protein
MVQLLQLLLHELEPMVRLSETVLQRVGQVRLFQTCAVRVLGTWKLMELVFQVLPLLQ